MLRLNQNYVVPKKEYPSKHYSINQKGRRNVGSPNKRWRDQLHLEDYGIGNTPTPSENYDDDDDPVVY